jgi:hypothetical protein
LEAVVGGYYGGLFAQHGHAVTCVAATLDVKDYTRGLEAAGFAEIKVQPKGDANQLFEEDVPEKVIFSAMIVARKP